MYIPNEWPVLLRWPGVVVVGLLRMLGAARACDIVICKCANFASSLSHRRTQSNDNKIITNAPRIGSGVGEA